MSVEKVLSQNSDPMPLHYNATEFDHLYKRCENIRPDSIVRLCIDFMSDYNLKRNKEAFELFHSKIIKKAEENNKLKLLNRFSILEIIGKLRFNKASTKEAVDIFESKFHEFLEIEDYSAGLEILSEWSRFHHKNNENIEKLKVLFYGEKFSEKYDLQDDVNYQAIINMIGYTLWKLENPVTSTEYFLKSLNPIASDFERMLAYNAIGMNYQNLDSLDQSLYYFNKALKIGVADNHEIFITVIQGNAAYTLFKLGKFKEALTYAKNDKETSLKEKIYENAVGALSLMIKIELQQNHWVEAKKLLDEFPLVMSCISNNDFFSYKRYKEAEYLFFEKTRNHEKALISFKEYKKYDDLFMEDLNKNKISQLKIDAEIKIYASEMEKNAAKIIFKNNIKNVLMIVFLLGLGIIIYYLIIKSKAIEKGKLEIENINKNQAEEIEHLKNELNNLIAKIITENEKYQKVISLTENEHPGDMAIENNLITLAQTLTDSNENIEHLKNYNLSRNEQWHEFKNLFLKLYPAFDIKLNEKLGKVSNAELRLMMLHKLGLSSKEIAQILFISIEGVKKSKYRLYKKMGISSNTELDMFLQKL